MTDTVATTSAPASPSERLMDIRATWTARGIPLDNRPAQVRMLDIAEAVGQGVQMGSVETKPENLHRAVSNIAPSLRGFAWEGVAMRLTLADLSQGLLADRDLSTAQIASAFPNVRNWLWVGVGLALGQALSRDRNNRQPLETLWQRQLTAETAMLIGDGLGYVLGASQPASYIDNDADLLSDTPAPQTLLHAMSRGFDQGLGRAIWFLDCGEPEHIIKTMNRFEVSPRAADIWGGVGYAGTYSGGAPIQNWRPLLDHLRLHHGATGWLAQGIACAAHARERTTGADAETHAPCLAAWKLGPPAVTSAFRKWLDDRSDESPAFASNDWFHCRAPLEFRSILSH